MSTSPQDAGAVPVDAERLVEMLRGGDAAGVRALLAELPHPSDVADLLERLDEEDRGHVVAILAADPALAAEALSEMEWDEHPEDTLAALAPEQIAAVVAQLADDDAADMIGELEPEERDRVLAALPTDDAGEIRDLLRYDEESAGGIMTTEMVVVSDQLTAGEAIDEVRRQAHEVEEFFGVVFVTGAGRRLRGTVSLRDLVVASPGATVAELAKPPVATVLPGTDQEEVGRVISRYNLAIVPVVSAQGVLLGGVTFDDVIDVIESETTEDLLRFASVSSEEELRGRWWDAVRSRLPWLYLNLLTAFAAAAIVALFQDTIRALPYLAAWMPVIAGMGGNTGTQALAVTVRRLALSPDQPVGRWRIVGKEVLVGLANGLANGAIVALVALFINQSPMLGLVVLLAMWANLAVAGFAGAFVPITLERVGVDPAIASSIFVTTLTDIFGFLLLLGLATNLLL